MNFLSSLNIKDKLLLTAGAIIIFLYVLNSYNLNRYKKVGEDLARTEHNLKAASDEIRAGRDREGKIELAKLAFLVEDLKELKRINAELAREVEITKGTVALIQKQGFKIIRDTFRLETEVPQVLDGVATIDATHDTTYSEGNYRKLGIETKYNLKDSSATSKVTKDELGFTAVTGLKQSGDGYEIFVRPDFPGLTLTQLEGAIIDKNLFKTKAKRPLITLGGHVGWSPFSYNAKTKLMSIDPNLFSAGVGVNVNILTLISK